MPGGGMRVALNHRKTHRRWCRAYDPAGLFRQYAPIQTGGIHAPRLYLRRSGGERFWLDALGRRRDEGLELVGIEASDPRWIAEAIDGLVETAHRLRALGAIAITLCEVAAARLDGMVTLIRARGVDGAAGQLIVREAGGVVSFPNCAEPLGAPLDSQPVSYLVAARTERGMHELERVVAS